METHDQHQLPNKDTQYLAKGMPYKCSVAFAATIRLCPSDIPEWRTQNVLFQPVHKQI